MEHLALYRQFRPMTFDEVVEQKHIVTALRQSVASGQIAHAYLFSGTRGTGKTSIAKILSRAINCLDPDNGNPCNRCDICTGILEGSILDVIEMDAASNNSVDNIRRICDEVLFMPSRAKYKVYIVDEVHMLSTGAFNALLKTLEEPPAHAVFILATTEPHRIPATIISRCQRYDFRRIPLESIVERLRDISEKNGISIHDDALETIAKLSDGALRDAISLLDQVSGDASSVIQRDDILKMTGVVDDRFLLSMAESILTGNSVAIIDLCDRLIMDGRDILRFTLDLARYFRDLLVIGISRRSENLVRATAESITEMRRLSDHTTKDSLLRVITRLSELASELKWSPDMRTSFEIALLALGAENIGKEKVFARETPSDETETPLPSVKAEPVTAPPEPVAPPESEPDMTTPSEPEPEPVASPEPEPDLIPPPEADPEEISLTDEIQRTILSDDEESVGSGRHVGDKVPVVNASDYSKIAPLTPNLTRTAEPASPVRRPITNLSVVTSVPPVRNANIPLPPVIPDIDSVESDLTSAQSVEPVGEAKQEAAEISPETPSLSHMWDILIKRWEDTMILESLQLRHARVEIHEDELRVIFPDIMRSYIDQLTQRIEYKRIKEDAMTLISGVRDLRIMTDSDMDPAAQETDHTGKGRREPDWVGRIKAFAEQSGVEVQTIDDM
jgi:DNA polymerase III subunit gamma/tau